VNKYAFLIFFLAINTGVFPNDTRAFFGGSLDVIDNEDTNIIMQEETINIRLFRSHYEVDVTFIFYNSGENEEILLGFPVELISQPFPDNREWAILDDFKSYINGNLITEYIIREETKFTHEDRQGEYDYITATKWYLRRVLFPRHENTISKVTYKAPYGHRASGHKHAGYIFGTGYNWKGPIGKMNINIKHGDDILLDSFSIGRIKDGEIISCFSWEGDGEYKFKFNNIEPIISDKIHLYIRECNMFNTTVNEFGHYWEGWIWDEYLLDTNISDNRLYTKNQLRLFINFFYAIHGYDFKNPLYKNFFQNLWYLKTGNDKYSVNYNFSENNFNEIERRNIDYLLRLERMIP
jgi:hypothetical protein